MAKKRRRSNGQGTIYQVNGKWIAQISYYKDGKLKRPKRTCDKHSDAVVKLAELQKEASQLDLDEQHHTVESYLNEWLEDVKNGGRAKNTFKSYNGVARKHIIPHIGRVLLRKLKASKIRNMIKTLQSANVGTRQIELAYIVLNAALNVAYKEDIILKNPCLSVSKPTHKIRDSIPFTMEERGKIFAEAEGTFFYPMYRFMLATGMRSTELFGLHWSDIDYDSGTIHVQRKYLSGEYGELKSKYSDRFLDLTPGIIKLLEMQKELLKKKGFHKNEYVFCGIRGGHLNSNTFSQQFWNPLLERAGVNARGMHHLRHTFASELLADNADLLVVSKLLGHSSPAITLDFYAHVMPPKRSQVANKIDRLFG